MGAERAVRGARERARPALTRGLGWGARTPLRIKLVVGLLALVAVALAVTGVTAAAVLNGYLVDRVDGQLVTGSRAIVAIADRGFTPMAGRGRGLDRFALPSAFYVEVRGADGELVGAPLTAPLAGQQPPPDLSGMDAAHAAARAGRPYTVSSTGSGDHPWRVLVTPLAGGAGSVAVAMSLDDVQSTVHRLELIDLVVSVVVLTLLGGLGYGIVRTSLRPLEEIEATAEAIAAGDLSRRVPDRDPRTEVGRLGRALNGMLTQIEAAFHSRAASEARARESEERMRRFVADASHELRTPLTSIRGFAELYRQGAAPDPSDVARLMRRIEDESARMGLLVEDLLLLARLDQQRQLERHPVDLLTLAVDAVHDARVVAPARAVDLDVVGTDHAPMVTGDEPRLRQVVGNLVGNALTHTPPRSPVTVRVGTMSYDGADWALLEVADAGSGLAPEDVERVFERFYRADASRTRAHGGAGLGLSIVAALVAAHGGAVDVESQAGRGASFRVRLPLREPLLPAPASPSSQPTDSLAEGMSQQGRQL